MTALPYIYRWNRPAGASRKGERCAIVARSRRAAPVFDARHFIGPVSAARAFNTVCLVFADGFRMTTSGNAIRRAGEPETPTT